MVYTDFRPTPLQHYIFPAGADGMHMVVDEKSVFREDNFSKAVAAVGEAADAAAKAAGERDRQKGSKGRVAQEQDSDIFKIVRMIMERGYDPVSPPFSLDLQYAASIHPPVQCPKHRHGHQKRFLDAMPEGSIPCWHAIQHCHPALQHPVCQLGLSCQIRGNLVLARHGRPVVCLRQFSCLM